MSSSPRTDPARALKATTRWLAYAIVAAGAVIMLAPFWFMLVFATHSNTEILSVPPPAWFGDHLMANLADLYERRPHFWRSLGLSLGIAAAVAALNLFFCSLAGYAFAMFDFRGREPLFALVLATMMLPTFASMIPTILLMQSIGWIDSPKALIVPGACGALGIFMMRQYIGSSIPRELIEAARMDGCSEFSIYWRVVLPLLGPALGTLGLVTFIGSYNNFVGALLVLRDQEHYTVPLVLRSLQGTTAVAISALSAGAAVTVLPLLVIFAFFSRRLIEGLTAGAVKG